MRRPDIKQPTPIAVNAEIGKWSTAHLVEPEYDSESEQSISQRYLAESTLGVKIGSF